MKRFDWLIIVTWVLFPIVGQAQEERGPIRIAFWNVESFFDPYVDSTLDYNDYAEEGQQHWTKTRFYRKRNNTYKAILALSESRPIGIMGLCEVENENVLRAVFQQTPLRNYHYRWVHYEGPDRRGIDPAIVYSLDHFMLVESAVFPYYNPEDTAYRSRDILYAKFISTTPPDTLIAGSTRNPLRGMDTIHVFVNHWPSRYNGELETVGSRACAAVLLRSKVDSIMAASPEGYTPKIIIMGDFNDTPSDESLHDVLKARRPSECEDGCLVNLFADTKTLGFEGTLKHLSDWQVFDQIIVTESLLNDREGLHYQESSAAIFHPDFLLTDDETHRGKKPFRTYLGPRYIGGFSDHLPVCIDLVR
jgi:hypothetical protein